jgi:hypothetical protein
MKAPFYSWRVWRRIVIKGLILLLIANVLFIVINPLEMLLPWSLFGHLVPYRTRLVPAEDNDNVQLASLETLIHAHEISQPKAPDEFRVIILGDSGIYGWGNADADTISGQLNVLGIKVAGKKLRAYNLAAPFLSTTRDLLIADAVSAYKPDMVVWFVTLQGFRNNDRNPLVELNAQRMTALTARFGLDDENARSYGHVTSTLWDRSLFGQRQVIYRWLKFQTYVFRPDKPEPTDHRAIDDRLSETPPSPEASSNYMPMPNATWSPLLDMQPLLNVPVLIVNEPILIVPNNVANYDGYYGVALYDHYREAFRGFCADHQLWCLDIWNALPATAYTDTPLHHTASGNFTISESVALEIQRNLHIPTSF